jgi:hypothetical protein
MKPSPLRLAVSIAFCSLALFAASGAADKAPTYIGQDIIDGLVDKAYFVLNSADDPSSGFTLERAIAAAKEIAAKLRTIAHSDANKKYILGKVNELEGQIYLEEKGLLLEKDQWKQKTALALIPQFNSALGQTRPCFAELRSMALRLESLDAQKAAEAAASIAKRAAALAREVPASIDAALRVNNSDSARVEIAYCQVNGAALGLSPAACAALEAKVAARTNADDERAFVAKSLDRCRAALSIGNLADARKERLFSGGKLASLRTRLVPHEWNRLNKDYELLDSKLDRKEDSLCAVARARLREGGPSAAADFLDTMARRGVSPERIGSTDHLILEAAVAQKKRESPTSAGIVPTANDTAGGGSNALDDLLTAARKAAAEKNDSLSANKAQRGRSTQVDEVRKDRLRVAYTLWKIREEQKQTTEQQCAFQELVDIYTSLELRKPADAYRHFSKAKDFLKKNLPPGDFVKITAAVQRQCEGQGK